MALNNITKKDVFFLLINGNVNFGESSTRAEIKTYKLNNVNQKSEQKVYVIEDNNLKVSFKLFELDSAVFISEFHGMENTGNCSDKSNVAKSMYMPNDMTLEKLSSNEFRFEKVFTCEMECFDIKDSDIESLFIDGQVLFNHSYPNKKPNPLYFIEKEINDVTFIFWIEQGATKTRINRVVELEKYTDKSKTYAIEYLFSEKPKCYCNY